MATVEGVFHILDRASPALRSIERQALKTDFAIQKVGTSLDGVTSRKRLQSIETLERKLRTTGLEADNLGKRADKLGTHMLNLDRRTQRTTVRIDQFSKGLKRMFGELVKIGMTGGKMLGMGAGIGFLAQGIGALSGGVIGLIPRIADLGRGFGAALPAVTGIGIAMVTAHLAFRNLTAAMQGNRLALRSLTPNAVHFMRELRAFRPVLREFTKSSQNGLFAGLRVDLRDIRAAAPTINKILSGMSGQLGNLARVAGQRLLSRGFLADFQQIAGQGGQIVNRGGRFALNMIDAFRHIAIAARPFTDWLTRVILLWSRHFAASERVRRSTGELARRFNQTKESLKVLWHFLTGVWHAMKLLVATARPLGNILWSAANRSLDRWNTLHSTISGRAGLTSGFLKMADGVKAVMRLLGAVGGAVFRLGQSSTFPKLADTLTKKVVPALEHALNYMSNTFGPPILDAITSAGRLLGSLSGAGGPISTMLHLLARTADAITALVNALGPLKRVIGAAFSLYVIQRYLVMLGLLQKGWLGVAASARTAAVAEGSASGIGAGGFLGGLFSGRRAPGLAASLEAQRMAGGPLGGAMKLTGLARLGAIGGRLGAVAGKLFWPLAAISGATGAMSAQTTPGASFGYRATQRLVGAENALTLGLAGHLFGDQFLTPEQKAGKVVAKDAAALQREIQGTQRIHGGINRAVAQIEVYTAHAQRFADDSSQAGKDWVTQLQQQTQALKDSTAAILAEKRAKDAQVTATLQQSVENQRRELIRRGVAPTSAARIAAQEGARRAGAYTDAERQKTAFASLIASSFAGIGHVPGARGATGVLTAGAQKAFARRHENYVIDPAAGAAIARYGAPHVGPVFTGSRGQVHSLGWNLGRAAKMDPRVGAPRVAAFSKALSDTLRAAGWPTPFVRSIVAYTIATGHLPPELASGRLPPLAPTRTAPVPTPSQQHKPDFWERNFPATTRIAGWVGWAGGGRIPGSGLGDTVPVAPGAMAAPGELIVNRHTERSVDMALGRPGALAGAVSSEHRRHSQPFAKGGRAPYVYPMGGLGWGRIDQGVDFSGSGQIAMIGAGTFTRVDPQNSGTGWPGAGGSGTGAMLVYRLDTGPAAGRHVFLAENVDPIGGLKRGRKLGAGKVFATARGASPFLETGWADAGGTPISHAWYTTQPDGTPTKGGQAFAAFLHGLSKGVVTMPTAGAGAVAAGAKGAGAAVAQMLSGVVGGVPTAVAKVPSTSTGALQIFARQQAATDSVGGFSGLSFAVSPGGGGGGGGKAPTVAGGGGKAPAVAAATTVAGASGGAGGWARAIARATGLNLDVAQAWVAAEGGLTPNGTGGFNALNVRPKTTPPTVGFSGVKEVGASPLGFARFGSFGDAITETAYWVNQMTNYKGIRDAIKSGSSAAERAAILASPWGTQHFATGGRVKWGGWHQSGGSFITSGPTVFGAGEGGKSEQVTIRPAGGHGPAVHVGQIGPFYGAHDAEGVGREVEAALHRFADDVMRHPHEGDGSS